MFKWFKNSNKLTEAQTLSQYRMFLSKVDYGTFQYMLFDKAIKLIEDGNDYKKIQKWVNKMESDWNKF